MTVSELTAWLSGQTSKQDRPFQRNLAQLFAFLDEVYDHPNP